MLRRLPVVNPFRKRYSIICPTTHGAKIVAEPMLRHMALNVGKIDFADVHLSHCSRKLVPPLPPHREPLPIRHALDRTGVPYTKVVPVEPQSLPRDSHNFSYYSRGWPELCKQGHFGPETGRQRMSTNCDQPRETWKTKTRTAVVILLASSLAELAAARQQNLGEQIKSPVEGNKREHR